MMKKLFLLVFSLFLFILSSNHAAATMYHPDGAKYIYCFYETGKPLQSYAQGACSICISNTPSYMGEEWKTCDGSKIKRHCKVKTWAPCPPIWGPICLNLYLGGEYETTDIEADCGSYYCESWGSNYCKNNDVYHSRICHTRGCSSNNCYDNPSTEEQKVNECGALGCSDRACVSCSSSGSCVVGETLVCSGYKCCEGIIQNKDSICCGDNYCETGENCQEDVTNCSDKKCYTPFCEDGCVYTFVKPGETDEACNNAKGCDELPCVCSKGECISKLSNVPQNGGVYSTNVPLTFISSYQEDNANYSWDFGNEDNSKERTPTYVYLEDDEHVCPGDYCNGGPKTVIVVATNSIGGIFEEKIKILINSTIDDVPLAIISSPINKVIISADNINVLFNASLSVDDNKPLDKLLFSWCFSDLTCYNNLTSSNGAVFYKNFTKAGDYWVALGVDDSDPLGKDIMDFNIITEESTNYEILSLIVLIAGFVFLYLLTRKRKIKDIERSKKKKK